MISSSRPDRRSDRAAAGRRLPMLLVGIAGGVLVVGLATMALLREFQRGPAGGYVPADDDSAAMVLGIADRRYVDPAGRFSITVPSAWAVRTGEQANPNDVVLRGPVGLEVWVRLADVGYDRFERLSDEIRQIEENYGINSNIRITMFGERPAVERHIRLFDKEAISLDFLVGTTNHHIQLAAQKERFEALEPLLRQILATYAPGTNAPPSDLK